jgi:CHAT domain-containing protein/tetratricopeptide (TPR) repeat protein
VLVKKAHVLQSKAYNTSALTLMTDAGHSVLDRYRRTQNKKDLEQSIAHFERALGLCPADHLSRHAALFNLALAKFTRCQVNGTYLNLDTPISLFQDALDSCPTGHLDRPTIQLHLAIALLSRFAKRGFEMDADAAKELLNEVINVCHAKSHIHRSALFVIKTYVLHPARSVDANDLPAEEPITSTFPLTPGELARRWKLCEHTGDPHSIDEVISLHYEALGYYSKSHPDRELLLCNLGGALGARYQHQGIHRDLDEAIAFLNEARALLPADDPGRAMSVNNLAAALSARFDHRGDDKDLDEAIKLHEEALNLMRVGHPYRYMALNNLANGVSTRFKHRGNDGGIDVITLLREALDLSPVDHPGRQMSLSNLANALITQFRQQGDHQVLDEAIALHRKALYLNSFGHPNRPRSLNNLSSALRTRFKEQCNDCDLDEAITLDRETLNVWPPGHPDRSGSLNNLANALKACFDHRGDHKDLEEAITLHREALDLRPAGHPDHLSSLNNLANALSTRFEHRGHDKDIDEAITLQREALDLRIASHHDRGWSLNNLASALITRFGQRGNHQDLDEAITLHRDALYSMPDGHPLRPGSLTQLANALSTRFDQRGNDKDIDEAIMFDREALNLMLATHQDRTGSLRCLARALNTRFTQRGNGKDIDEAITLHREALHLMLRGHTHMHRLLGDLANALSTRFKHRGNDKDIDEAITVHIKALDLTSVGHPDRFASLSNLASQLSDRFQQRGNENDLNKAILLHTEALNLTQLGHPERFGLLNNLAGVFMVRFVHDGNVHDLYEALANARSAWSLLTKNDPCQLLAHGTLATTYLHFHQSRLHSGGNDVDSLSAAMGHFKAGADVVSGGLLSRLRISLHWVREANKYAHSTLLEAYATSMQLLDAYMSVTASVSSRHDTMKLFPPTLAVDAASCALRRGEVCLAVELLEQGRTLIWTQMARFRTPLDNFQEQGNHAHAPVKKFREFSYLLDKPPVEFPEGIPKAKEEAEAVRYKHLVDGWNEALQDIRTLEGFSRFMLPPQLSDLRVAARDGPIIVLIASESSCNAIIIHHQQSPISVPLSTDVTKLQRLVVTLRQTVQRDTDPKEPQGKLIAVLRDLWVDVVCPVVQKLGESPPGSRIWWCPTSFFNFLPLHAAGEYRKGGKDLSKLYISSYTPSLTALIRARRRHQRSQPMPFAAIGQNHPPGYPSPLPSVEPELELVQSLLPPPPTVSFTKITSVESTKSRALGTLRDNHWLHFACHGIQNAAEPFKSAFLMRDEPLTLLDITQMDLSRHEFAFLSACETAVGNFKTPDEVIHLAAALQFAGVKSVIGTFWNVDDSTVRRLVEAFYKNLCGDGKMIPKRAARALHMAVQLLANDKDIALDQRIVFMHVGI